MVQQAKGWRGRMQSMWKLTKWQLGVLAGAVACPAAAGAADLVLHAYQRPPFMVVHGAAVSGITADIASKVVARAGLSFRWELTPARRQLAVIGNSRRPECGVGWFRTPERERVSHFTRPLYRDRGVVLIARPGLPLPSPLPLAQLLENPAYTVLVKDGLTYGRRVQQALQGKVAARLIVASIEQPQMVRMISAGRADAMFATQEEAQMLLVNGENGHGALRLLPLADMPSGDMRYLMCSRRVPRDWMQRLDAAILAEVGPLS